MAICILQYHTYAHLAGITGVGVGNITQYNYYINDTHILNFNDNLKRCRKTPVF